MGGIARENDCRALSIGGMAEHAHLLLSLKPAMPIANAIKIVKTVSSGWMSDLLRGFQMAGRLRCVYCQLVACRVGQTLHR